MCGIFAILNHSANENESEIEKLFMRGKHRGPEHSDIKYESSTKYILGFHRLAINGLNQESNQPIEYNNIVLICNGEIYNYKDLYMKHEITPKTDSDCEIIIHMYLLYGIEYTLNLLDGVFAFVLFDKRNINQQKCFIGRDPFGVRPLYYSNHFPIYQFASELKQLGPLFVSSKINHFPPGSYLQFNFMDTIWIPDIIKKYHTFSFLTITEPDYNIYLKNIVHYLNNAVKKRTLTTDRPVACLLSGGLDSSLIAALVRTHYKGKLETYSIGLPGSEDLKYAQLVADHIGSEHTSIEIPEDEFFESIPDVIYDLESYDTTSVRASVGNWLLGKYISEYSEAKVIFNGDGADELMGGYLYLQCAPNSIEFDRECKRLLKEIHAFDVLRSDKSISSHGLEPRTPFLDRGWVQYYLSIPSHVRFHIHHKAPELNNCEKYLVREAFSKYMHNILPDVVMWRKKEAFSDGVSSKNRSWYEIIQEKVNTINETTNMINDSLSEINYNIPKTPEQHYYRYLFENSFPKQGHIVPHFWMPKYIDATDASARTLSIYDKDELDV